MENQNLTSEKRRLSPKEKRLKKKEQFIKAKQEYENHLAKRKMEVAELLFKIHEDVGDYDNAILKDAFAKMVEQLRK